MTNMNSDSKMADEQDRFVGIRNAKKGRSFNKRNDI